MQHVTNLLKIEYEVTDNEAAFGNNLGCYTDSRLRSAAKHR